MPTTATLKNAYLSRKNDDEKNMKVPQSFSFMCREGVGFSPKEIRLLHIPLYIYFLSLADLPGQGHNLQTDENVPRRLRMGGSLKDVFAMVKGFMSDQELIQPPLCVYPESFLSSTEQYFNRVNSTQDIIVQHLEPDRVSELEALATMISKDFPSFDRGVRYYRSLIDMDRPRKPFDRLAFVDAGPMIGQGLAQVQLPARPPAAMNHWLQVVFHHSRG